MCAGRQHTDDTMSLSTPVVVGMFPTADGCGAGNDGVYKIVTFM